MTVYKTVSVLVKILALISSAVQGISVSDLEQRITVLESNMPNYKEEAQKQAISIYSLETEVSKGNKDRHRLEETISQLQTQIQSQEQHYHGVVTGLLSKAALTEDKLVNLTRDYDQLALTCNLSLAEMTMVRGQVSQFNYLTSQVQTLDQARQNLEAKVNNQDKDLTDLKTKTDKIANLSTASSTLQVDVSDLQKVVETIQSSRQKVVAFTSYLGKQTTIRGRTNVKFDRITLNMGNHYNTSTGIFTCPYSGVYVFHLHAMVSEDGKFELAIMTSTTIVPGVYNGLTSTGFHHSSNTMLLQLSVGDEVMVNAYTTSYLSGFSSFSGYLLHAD